MISQRSRFVERAAGFKLAGDVFENRMPGLVRIDARGGSELVAVVHMIIAAEHFMIPFLPVFERMAGCAQADDRFASSDKFFDVCELVVGQSHSTYEKNGEIGAVQRFDSGDVVAGRALQAGATEMIICLKQLLECRKTVR